MKELSLLSSGTAATPTAESAAPVCILTADLLNAGL